MFEGEGIQGCGISQGWLALFVGVPLNFVLNRF